MFEVKMVKKIQNRGKSPNSFSNRPKTTGPTAGFIRTHKNRRKTLHFASGSFEVTKWPWWMGMETKTTKVTPLKFNSSPLKTDRNPIGKYVVFPSIIFGEGELLKLQGGTGSFQTCCPQMFFITFMPPKRIWSWSRKKVKRHVWKISYTEATHIYPKNRWNEQFN